MANPEHLDLLKKGVEVWNQWREEHPEIEPDLSGANLEGARLSGAHLERARLSRACLEKADLRDVHLEGAHLSGANLKAARLSGAHLEGARLTRACLEKTNLKGTYLEKAHLWSAHLEGARLTGTHLEKAHLWDAHLEGAHLLGAHLEGADLSHASFDHHSYLEGLVLRDGQHGSASLVDINWNGANLAVIQWEHLTLLGEEQAARQSKTPAGKGKDKDMRLEEYQTAVRANRQLAVALREQGLNEEADRFSYRAQLCQRIVWRWQRRPLKYLGSWLLWLLAGYGYRPGRSILIYLLIIFSFGITYHLFGDLSLWPPDAFVYSLTSFHGRGFFPGLQNNHSLHDPLILLAALEAVLGLLVEVSFIATFTQRFFAR